MIRNTGKPKFKIGEWVKFQTGNRILRGCIASWYLNSADAVIYDIGRNKQTFRLIYESNVLESSPDR